MDDGEASEAESEAPKKGSKKPAANGKAPVAGTKRKGAARDPKKGAKRRELPSKPQRCGELTSRTKGRGRVRDGDGADVARAAPQLVASDWDRTIGILRPLYAVDDTDACLCAVAGSFD